MKIKRIIWLTLGFIGLGLGVVGAVIPMIPAFPFLMLALFSFGKSSEKLHKWFIGTNLYKNNLESFVKGQGMTWKTKIKIMITVTLLMAFGFFMMFRKDLYIPCTILGGVWLFHILYFIFGIKKYEPSERFEKIQEKETNEIE
ncbi:MAG: YbaN family protein [Clostridia bacterium]|nr:YbaN family protein [Clostridia bacterium]